MGERILFLALLLSSASCAAGSFSLRSPLTISALSDRAELIAAVILDKQLAVSGGGDGTVQQGRIRWMFKGSMKPGTTLKVHIQPDWATLLPQGIQSGQTYLLFMRKTEGKEAWAGSEYYTVGSPQGVLWISPATDVSKLDQRNLRAAITTIFDDANAFQRDSQKQFEAAQREFLGKP